VHRGRPGLVRLAVIERYVRFAARNIGWQASHSHESPAGAVRIPCQLNDIHISLDT
jgi:hypothetical protein